MFWLCSPGSVSACASQGFGWTPVNYIRPPAPTEYPDAPAVVLLDERRILLNGPYTSGYSEVVHVHQLIHVRSEGGYREAAHKIEVTHGAAIEQLSARTISAAGRVHKLRAGQVFEEEVEYDDARGTRTVFALPQVRPGTTIELRYTVRMPWIRLFRRVFVQEALPVLERRVTIDGTDDIRYVVRASGPAIAAAGTIEEGGGGILLNWRFGPQPAAKKEPFAGDPSHNVPWWSFNVVGFQLGGQSYNANRNWTAAHAYAAERLFDGDEYYAGFEPDIDFAECDPECRVRLALKWTAERLHLREDGDAWKRTARQVMEAQRANQAERARILFRLLELADLEPQLAWTHLRHIDFVDEDSPNEQSLRYLLVFVPKQAGLPKDLWLDAASPHCRVGSLPARHVGSKAVVLNPGSYERRPGKGLHGLVEVDATVCGQDISIREELSVRVDPKNGDATVRTDLIWHGRAALLRLSADAQLSEVERRTEAEEHASQHAPSAQLLRVGPVQKVDERGQATQQLDFKVAGFAVAEGGQLTVPLSLLASSWEELFTESVDKRQSALRVADVVDRRELLRLSIPPNMYLSSHPPPLSVKSKLFELEASVHTQGNTVTVERSLRMRPGVLPVEAYARVKAVFDALRKVNTWALGFETIPEAPPGGARF